MEELTAAKQLQQPPGHHTRTTHGVPERSTKAGILCTPAAAAASRGASAVNLPNRYPSCQSAG